jgi:hypothetical protein
LINQLFQDFDLSDAFEGLRPAGNSQKVQAGGQPRGKEYFRPTSVASHEIHLILFKVISLLVTKVTFSCKVFPNQEHASL